MIKPKNAKQDYTYANMPHNRKEVFLDILKLHFADLLRCGFVLLLFALPFCGTTLYKNILVMNFQSQLMSHAINGEQILYEIKNAIALKNLITLLEIPLLMLFAVGLSGIARVIRQYGWEENVYFKYDFRLGVKQNIKQMLFLAFIIGLVRLLYICFQNLIILSLNGMELCLLIVPSVIMLVVFAPIIGFILVCISIYNNTLSTNVRVGFALYGGNIFKTLVIFICCASLSSIGLIPNIYCKTIGLVVYILLLPIIMLGWWLFTYNLLDIKINSVNHPELIGKGIVFEKNQDDFK